jgi:hypothetical protein
MDDLTYHVFRSANLGQVRDYRHHSRRSRWRNLCWLFGGALRVTKHKSSYVLFEQAVESRS